MKNKIIKSVIVTIIVFLFSFVAVESLILSEKNKTYKGEVDYVIVLGARLYGDIPSPTLRYRLDSALDYLSKHKDSQVIVSGGQGADETTSEAVAMKTYLKNKNIKPDRIIAEDQSFSTFENLKYSIDIIKDLENRDDIKIMIVSSDYHLFRAKMIAKQFNLTAYTKGAQTPPSVVYKAYIREYFAVIKSFIFDRI